MITTSNYFKEIEKIDFSVLPEALRKGHDFLQRATDQGNNWNSYQSSDAIKKTVNIYITKLNEFIGNNKKPDNRQGKKARQQKDTRESVQKSTVKQSAKANEKKVVATDSQLQPIPVERIPEELRFIRRFINLSGKSKTKDDILRFINSLQKSIVEKRIRKTSSYARQIKFIQDKLIGIYNGMKSKITIQLKPETLDELKSLTRTEKVMSSVGFIKSYINLNGKTGVKKKAEQLLKRITRKVDKKLIPANDPYMDELVTITRNLETFLDTPSQKTLTIEKNELNGLEGIMGGHAKRKTPYDSDEKKMKAIRQKGNIITFKRPFYPRGTANEGRTQIIVTGINKEKSGSIKIEGRDYDSDWYESKEDLFNAIDWEWMQEAHTVDGCACEQLNGLDKVPSVMNSMDFANMQFATIGLKGKWLKLIGDPSGNFTAMVFGQPKMGKSYLCVEFAGYLARHHGKVLYVAKEEGLDYTLQQKLKDKEVAHPNFFVASILPDNLDEYDFVFLDSVNKLGLTPDDLTQMKSSYPSKSFIFIFQSTKGGKFRGANSFQHDVDIVIEVPQWGRAVQMGRFNQGGEMEIFSKEE